MRTHLSSIARMVYTVACISLLAFLGCRSAPPPPPAASAVTMAERAESQAQKLSDQGQNWPAAARAWQLAADRFSLLNDLAGEAVALHNLAQAQSEIDQLDEAHKNLERAASLNQRIARTNELWRNQIALLQIEARSGQTDALQTRFASLTPQAEHLHSPALRGLFLNELGLWQKSQQDFAKAEHTFTEAEKQFKDARDQYGWATIAANSAELAEAQADYAASIRLWQQALAKFQAVSDPPGIARSLAGQGRALLAAKKDLPEAEALLRRAAHNFELLQKPREAAAVSELLAKALAAQGKASP
jgi:tetratricopeptide (TPR) repeat protein